jgi:hypothetical protein
LGESTVNEIEHFSSTIPDFLGGFFSPPLVGGHLYFKERDAKEDSAKKTQDYAHQHLRQKQAIKRDAVVAQQSLPGDPFEQNIGSKSQSKSKEYVRSLASSLEDCSKETSHGHPVAVFVQKLIL